MAKAIFNWLTSGKWTANLIIVVIALLGCALAVAMATAVKEGREISFWPPTIGARPTGCSGSLVLLRHREPAKTSADVTLTLVEVKSLEGHRSDDEDPNGGHTANLNLMDLDHVLDRLLEICGVRKYATRDEIKKWSHDEWVKFLDGLKSPMKRSCLLDTPFARFRVRMNGDDVDDFEHKYFFENEWLKTTPSTTTQVLSIQDAGHRHLRPDSAVLQISESL